MPTIYQQDYIYLDVVPGELDAIEFDDDQWAELIDGWKHGRALEYVMRITAEDGTVVLSKVMAVSGDSHSVSYYFAGQDTPFTRDFVEAEDIELDKETATVQKTKTVTLTAVLDPVDATSAITWESSDETAATVEDGVVTGVAAGSATITATANGHSATCAVTVTN